jgi:hypothetical protein
MLERSITAGSLLLIPDGIRPVRVYLPPLCCELQTLKHMLGDVPSQVYKPHLGEGLEKENETIMGLWICENFQDELTTSASPQPWNS